MDRERELILAEMDADADRLQGLSPGRPRLRSGSPGFLRRGTLARVDPETMEWMSGISAEDRQRSLSRARLLAGTTWHASGVLIDQLFQDVPTLHEKEWITREETAVHQIHPTV